MATRIFKKGDKVRLTERYESWGSLIPGDIVTVHAVGNDGSVALVWDEENKISWAVSPSMYEAVDAPLVGPTFLTGNSFYPQAIPVLGTGERLNFPRLSDQEWYQAPNPRPRRVRRPKVEVAPPVIVKEKLTLASVVMSDEKREEIKVAMSQVDNQKQIFDTWGFSEVFEKGTAITLLFYGIPGGGKTMTAQAIASDLNADLKIYGNAEIQSSEPGGAERVIKKMFETARSFFLDNKKQQVILLDECDALLYDRNKVGVILGAQINTLLTEIEKHDGVVIFTTNRIGVLDPALERRIAAKIEFPFPDPIQRKAIWERMIPKKAPLADDVDFISLSGYELAGGNIKNAVLNAARTAAYKKEDKISMERFVTAAKRELSSQEAFRKKYETHSIGYMPKEDIAATDDHKLSITQSMNSSYEVKRKESHADRIK